MEKPPNATMVEEKKPVTFQDIKENPNVKALLLRADTHLEKLGYTEHGFRHCSIVARNARKILHELGFPARDEELVQIAGYLHDIGNVVSRVNHPFTGASIALQLLREMGMPVEEILRVMTAVGNHDESSPEVTDCTTAAVLLADKTDVHRSRVRNPKMISFDIHDRVNYACTHSSLSVDPGKKTICLSLTIDTEISHPMEYFEIFLSRMLVCKKAAEFLACSFEVEMNGVRML